jgi:hypothetical protein
MVTPPRRRAAVLMNQSTQASSPLNTPRQRIGRVEGYESTISVQILLRLFVVRIGRRSQGAAGKILRPAFVGIVFPSCYTDSMKAGSLSARHLAPMDLIAHVPPAFIRLNVQIPGSTLSGDPEAVSHVAVAQMPSTATSQG